MFYSNGYAYSTERFQPFIPESVPEVAIYFPQLAAEKKGPFELTSGEIGMGSRMTNSAFWFNAYNASFGCDHVGPTACLLRTTAYAWDATLQEKVMAGQHYALIPPCPARKDCALKFVAFPKTYRKLSGIRFEMFANNESRIFVVDSLAVGWADNSCSAGLLRSRSRT